MIYVKGEQGFGKRDLVSKVVQFLYERDKIRFALYFNAANKYKNAADFIKDVLKNMNEKLNLKLEGNAFDVNAVMKKINNA